MTGVAILAVFAVVGLVAVVLSGRGLRDELRARQTLTRAVGNVDDVEFSKPGRPTGSRAIVSFVDTAGQTRRFTTEWSETPFSVGASVPVGYHATGKGAPRVLALNRLIGQAALTLGSVAFTGAAAYVLVRVWSTRP